MRKSTLLWLTLAAAASTILFHTSQKVTDGRSQLAQIIADTRQEEESLRVLQAEWSYLNQPERLEKLAAQYLPALAAQKGRQFMQLAELKDRMVEPAPEVEEKHEEASAPAVAADEAPRAEDRLAAEIPAGENNAMSVTAPIAEVEPAPEQVAIDAATKTAAEPVNAFAAEYRAAGPRKDVASGVITATEVEAESEPIAEQLVPAAAPEEAPPVKKMPVIAEKKKTSPPRHVQQAKKLPVAASKKSVPASVKPQSRNINDVIKGLGVQ